MTPDPRAVLPAALGPADPSWHGGAMTEDVGTLIVEDERDALLELRGRCPDQVALVESDAFDGVVMVQAVVTLTVASTPIVRAWLMARAEIAEQRSVTVDGNVYNGYTRRDVEKLMGAHRPSEVTDPSEPGPD
jgi:hypothetical protein